MQLQNCIKIYGMYINKKPKIIEIKMQKMFIISSFISIDILIRIRIVPLFPSLNRIFLSIQLFFLEHFFTEKTISWKNIRSNSLNSGLFAKLYKKNDEAFARLLLHTEILGLSRRSCLLAKF